MNNPADGSYYAEGDKVFRREQRNGEYIMSFGYAVCTINPDLANPRGAAALVAEALNDHQNRLIAANS